MHELYPSIKPQSEHPRHRPGGESHAYATAVVLVGLLVVINTGVSWLTKQFRVSKIHVL